MRWVLVGLAATVATIWGVGSVFDAPADVQHFWMRVIFSLLLFPIAIPLWRRWWRDR